MSSAVSDVTFNFPEEFFIHCAKEGLLPRIFDHTQADALVAEYKINPAWIDDIHANATAYFEAYLIETDQLDTINGNNEDAIVHIIMCTEVPDIANKWILQLQLVHVQDDFDNYTEALTLDDNDDDFVVPAARAMPDCHFGTRCTRQDCRFTHPTRPSAPAAPAAHAMPDCHFGTRCTRQDCHFTHPTRPSAPAAPATHPSAPATRPSAPTAPAAPAAPAAPIACYFRNSCTKRDCTYTHPGVPCNNRPCMNGSNCYKQGKSCPFHHPGDTCQH